MSIEGNDEAASEENSGFQVVQARGPGGYEDVVDDGWTMTRMQGMRRGIAVAAGTHHGLAILGICEPPKSVPGSSYETKKKRAGAGTGVPSLRSLCERAAQDMVDLSNVGSCCSFTETFPSPALRAYSIEYLFRNLDTAIASGMCNDLSERTWAAIERRLETELRGARTPTSPADVDRPALEGRDGAGRAAEGEESDERYASSGIEDWVARVPCLPRFCPNVTEVVLTR